MSALLVAPFVSVETRKAQVIRLLVSGVRQKTIAEQLGVGQPYVCRLAKLCGMSSQAKRWTEQDVALLRELHKAVPQLTYAEMSVRLGRNEHAVQQQTYRLGMNVRTYRPWTNKELVAVIEMRRAGKTLRQIAQRFGRDVTSVARYLRKSGVRKPATN